MKKRPTYLRAVVKALGTVFKGMRLSGKHFVKGYDRAAPLGIADPEYFKKTTGPITIQYPMEKVPVPDNGRYRLYMETDDCIGCDKCARVCPVDCITIETFRADGDLGKTSDGTTKRLHLPTFDIDMAKCMYCGLCTTVCPTECLTMTPVYDYSEYDRDNFLYHFGAYSPTEEVSIRLTTEEALAAKKAAKAGVPIEPTSLEAKPKGRPVMRPLAQPPVQEKADVQETPLDTSVQESKVSENPAPRPRPMMKRREDGADTTTHPVVDSIIPQVDPPEEIDLPTTNLDHEASSIESPVAENPPPKARPRPIMKPKSEPDASIEVANHEAGQETSSDDSEKKSQEPTEIVPPPKTRPRPVMRRPDNQDGGPTA